MNGQPIFNIKRLYLKKASFEQPNSPSVLLMEEKPEVEISLDVNVEPIAIGPNVHEISVDATIQAKILGKILFKVDCKQSGLFDIDNVTDEQLGAILNVVCPQIIYPYLRSNVTDLIVRGGFSPVQLDVVNFHALYEQRKSQKSKQEQSAQIIQTVTAAASSAAANKKKKKNGSS
ncbi:MAG: protein-export chaperone SecB [Burkholderiaceae bacterium]|jgi:preprotein translocase subunit SecB|nr:protein-export chaperone SecB [Burkholderiaceae bacterium]